MENPLTKQKIILRNQEESTDFIAIEEPLEISITHLTTNNPIRKKPISITMRSPGHDKELALGFLFSEGLLSSMDQVKQVRKEENKIDIVLKEEQAFSIEGLHRHFYTTSSCGVCGKSSIDALKVKTPDYRSANLLVEAKVLKKLPEKLHLAQATFQQTGGLHAAAVFNADGELLSVKEDVGRHNAMDKLTGTFFMENKLPINQSILLLSGRTSFELVQKAIMAGIQIICSIGAPSSLAIEMAEEHGSTLVGFLSAARFNIYTGKKRIVF